MNWKKLCAGLLAASLLAFAAPAFADDDPGPAAYSQALTGHG